MRAIWMHIFIGASLLTACPLMAQEASPDRVIVTGSVIPTASEVGPAPLDTISSADIERAGTDDPLIVLQKSDPSFTGNGTLGPTSAGISGNTTDGGSAIAIHNLPTLVLLNGRRLTDSAVLAAGGREFQDVNLFPSSFIQRIEVLKDGASAIYGSDAIGGVVNVYMDDNFTGAEAGGRYGVAENGDVADTRYDLITGMDTPEGTRLVIGVEDDHQDPLYSRTRDWAVPSLGKTTNYPGILAVAGPGGSVQYFTLNPALNSPSQTNPTGINATAVSPVQLAAGTYLPVSPAQVANAFDGSRETTIGLAQRRLDVYASAEQPVFGKLLRVFSDFLYASNQSEYAQNAQQLNNFATVGNGSPGPVVPAGSPYNPFAVTFNAMTPAIIADRFADYPRIFQQDTSFFRIVGGVRGDLSPRYSYETAFNYSQDKIDFTNPNLVVGSALNQAIAGGYNAAGVPTPGGAYSVVNGNLQPALDFFSRSPNPASLQGIFGTGYQNLETSLTAWDGRITGFPFDLPAGPLGFAAGGEYRHESLQANTGPGIFVESTPIQPIGTGRDIFALFGEIQIPVISSAMKIPGVYSLDFDAAVRYEDYSDAGDTVDPKASLIYRPIEDLALRGTYSKSFIAPTLYQTQGPSSLGATNVISFMGVPLGQAQALVSANPNLQPTKADTYTSGFVYSPHYLHGLTMSADFFEVDETQAVGTLDAQTIFSSVTALGPASPYAGLVHIGGPAGPGVTAPGQLAMIPLSRVVFSTPYQNLGGIKVQGFDFTTTYTHDFGGPGEIDLGLNATYYIKYDQQLSPGSPFFNTLRLYTTYEGLLPDYRLVPSFGYRHGGFLFTAIGTYLPPVHDAISGVDLSAPHPALAMIRDYYRADIAFSYEFGRRTSSETTSAAAAAKDGKDGKATAPAGEAPPAKNALLGALFTQKWYEGLKLTFGINNVTNTKPPSIPDSPADNTDTSTYDPYQRYFYVMASKKF